MTETDGNGEEDSDSDPVSLLEVQWFRKFVATLVFNGHRMKYLLVEYTATPTEFLARAFSPFSMLRNIHSVQFRTIQDAVFPYFRFLEDLMMGNGPQLFGDAYNKDLEGWTDVDYEL